MKNLFKNFFMSRKQKLINKIKTNDIKSIDFSRDTDLILSLCLNPNNWILSKTELLKYVIDGNKLIIYFKVEDDFFIISLNKYYYDNDRKLYEKCYFDSNKGLYYTLKVGETLQKTSKEEVIKYIQDNKQSPFFKLNDKFKHYLN